MASSSIERPTEDCFGDWIPEKMQEVNAIRKLGFWDTSMDDAATLCYDLVDLAFMNDRYCHFRHTYVDVHTYCQQEGSMCALGDIMGNVQKNAFNMITQVSSAVSVLQSSTWDDMDMEARGYQLNTLSHSLSQIFADLIAFNGTKVAALQ